MPNIIAVVGLSTFWSFVFMPRYGMLSSFFKMLGLEELAKIALDGARTCVLEHAGGGRLDLRRLLHHPDPRRR